MTKHDELVKVFFDDLASKGILLPPVAASAFHALAGLASSLQAENERLRTATAVLDGAPPAADRCATCGWPLASSADDGCVLDNCSMRP